ncbi:MAG: hypothetical protein ACRYG7_07625 [Janthinobacterium lividum]
MQSISPGQIRVQELASQFLKENPLLDPQKLKETSPQGYDSYKKFLALLEHDPIVCADPLLAQRIVVREVAISYVAWLGATSYGELNSTQVPILINFHRMMFGGSCFGNSYKEQDYERKVYQGCARTSTVSARAVLTLANGGVVFGSHINLVYYTKSRILDISTGNHRLLACKMLGIPTLANIDVDPKCITICDDQPNEPLNSALLYFEELYPHENLTKSRWQMQDIITYESLLLDLAATYQRSTTTDERNELYLFTKHDLAVLAELTAKEQGPRHVGEPVAATRSNNVLLNMRLPELLQDYVAVYTHLNTPPPQVSWFFQKVGRQPKITPLPENQQAIKSRWEEWRTTHIQAKI